MSVLWRARHRVAWSLLIAVCVAFGLSSASSVLALALQGVTEQPAPVDSTAPALVPRLTLIVGRSFVLVTEYDITRVAITNPAVADATVVEPRQIVIDGKAAGTVSLIVWGLGDRRLQYEVVVQPPVSPLQAQLHLLFPDEDIRVSTSEDAVVLSGRVSSNEVALRAAELAQASASKLRVINWLQGPSVSDTQQVMLQVRFAEVGRNALEELGASFIALGGNLDGRLTTQQFSSPNFDRDSGLTFSDFLNVFFFSRPDGLGFVIRALQQRGQFQSLAEPNLIAYNGQEASFLAGGELPIPLVQGGGINAAVSVQYREFGVRLTFRPTIVGDVIRLRVRPEVSEPDFSNGIELSGFSIPALSTRRVETDVELRDGQSFAIAGLLKNTSQLTRDAVPLLSKLPIIGPLFKSRAERSERSELLVLITPRLVKPLEPAEVPPLPIDPRRFISPGDGLGSAFEGGGGLVDAPPLQRAQP
jgi:pilus assembly protein CpaC